jgi:hypothetical protein
MIPGLQILAHVSYNRLRLTSLGRLRCLTFFNTWNLALR